MYQVKLYRDENNNVRKPTENDMVLNPTIYDVLNFYVDQLYYSYYCKENNIEIDTKQLSVDLYVTKTKLDMAINHLSRQYGYSPADSLVHMLDLTVDHPSIKYYNHYNDVNNINNVDSPSMLDE